MNKTYASIIALGMVVSGGLLLAWFVTPDSPERIRYWFINLIFFLPILGMLGVRGLVNPEYRRVCLPVFVYAVTVVFLAQWGPILPLFIDLYEIVPLELIWATIWGAAVAWMLIGVVRPARA